MKGSLSRKRKMKKERLVKDKQEKKCREGCLDHKYHCADCWGIISYSPANYASRPGDIPNPCENCPAPQQNNEAIYGCCYESANFGKNCPNHPPANEVEDWEEELGQAYYQDYPDGLRVDGRISHTAIVELFRKLIAQTREEWEDAKLVIGEDNTHTLHDKCENCFELARQEQLDADIKIVEGLLDVDDGEAIGWEIIGEKGSGHNEGCCPGDDAWLGYETALAEIIDALRSQRSEEDKRKTEVDLKKE